MIVRLRSNDGTPEEGIYHCVVEDADNIPQTVYVGLYNSGGGKMGYSKLFHRSLNSSPFPCRNDNNIC